MFQFHSGILAFHQVFTHQKAIKRSLAQSCHGFGTFNAALTHLARIHRELRHQTERDIYISGECS